VATEKTRPKNSI